MSHAHHEEAPLGPEESLAVIEESRARARRAMKVEEWPIIAVWGVAWVLGLGYTSLVAEGEPPVLALPGWSIGLVWLMAIGAAAVFTVAYLSSRGRGMGGASVEAGRLTGWAWMLSFAAAMAIVLLLRLEGAESGLIFVFTVSALYLAQAAAERDRAWFGMGVWIGAVNVAAYAALPERYSAVMALLGGGGLLVGAWFAWHQSREAERIARGSAS